MPKWPPSRPRLSQEVVAQSIAAFLKPQVDVVAALCYHRYDSDDDEDDFGVLRILNGETGATIHSIEFDEDIPTIVTYAPCGHRLVVTGRSGRLHVLLLESMAIIRTLQLQSEPRHIDYAPCGQLLAVGYKSGGVHIFDTESWEIIHIVPIEECVHAIAYASWAQHFAVGTFARLYIVNAESGTILHTTQLTQRSSGSIGRIASTPCGQLAVGRHSYTPVGPSDNPWQLGEAGLYILDARSGAILHTKLPEHSTNGLACAPRQQHLATYDSQKGDVHIFNTEAWGLIYRFDFFMAYVSAIAYAPCGIHLAFRCNHDLHILNTESLRSGAIQIGSAIEGVTIKDIAYAPYGMHAVPAISAPSSEVIDAASTLEHMAGTAAAAEHSVLQLVEHDEFDPPAIVSEEEAARFTAEQHAGFIERNINAAPFGDAISDTADEEAMRIIILEYSRNDAWFRRALLDSLELEECRQALIDGGHCPELSSGAKCFVPPNIFEAVVQALNEQGVETNKRHVIVSQDMERIVQDVVEMVRQSVSRRERGSFKMKSRAEIDIPDSGMHRASPRECNATPSSSAFPPFDVLIKRTFIDVQLPTSMRSTLSEMPGTV